MIKKLLSDTALQILIPLIGVVLGFELWQTKSISNLSIVQSVQAEQIDHINQAVNNAGEGEDTLREMMQDTQKAVEYIKGQIDSFSRYEDE